MSTQISDAVFWTAVVLCVVAQLFILRAVFHKPLVPAEGDRAFPQPRRVSEFAWAVLPAVLLVLLFVGAWRTMHRADVTSTPSSLAPEAGAASQP